jgi:hypothetical protein
MDWNKRNKWDEWGDPANGRPQQKDDRIFTWAAWTEPVQTRPERITKEEWPAPKQRTDLIFAKSCAPGNWCKTETPAVIEPASNFGAVMIAGAMLMPSAETAVAAALGIDFGLGRMAGGGVMQKRLNWAIRGSLRGATRIGGSFVLGMLPTRMGDDTQFTDDQLRRLNRASSRVRFQFRADPEGVVRVYGIHTTASGDDSVPIVQATWNADKTIIEAKLNDVTILWTPREGPLGTSPLVYPERSDELSTILVHPIPENTDSQLEGLPGEDLTTEDCIVVFPANTGMKSMYVVFARPVGGDYSYHLPPSDLTAFPDAVRVRNKGNRQRWESKKRIYEWDYQHGAVEVYDKQGRHLGEFDAETGEQTGNSKPERRITIK